MKNLLLRLLVLAVDVAFLLLAFFLVACLPDSLGLVDVAPERLFQGYTLRVMLFTCVLWTVLAWQERLFRIQLQDPWDVWFASLRALGKTALLLAIPLFLLQERTSNAGLLLALLMAMVALPLWRVALQALAFNRLRGVRDSLLIGDRKGLELLFSAGKWKRLVDGMGIRGLLLMEGESREGEFPLPVLGDLAYLERLPHAPLQLLVCGTHMPRQELSAVIHRVAGRSERLYILPDIAALDLAEVEIGRVGSQPVLTFNQGLRSPFNALMKRCLDIFGALAGLLVLGPLLLLLGIAIRLDSPGPIIYRHRRFGRGMKHIHLNKFRTMVINADEVLEDLLQKDPEARREWEELCKLKRDPRITRVGRVLRKVSLDELPQIVNVLLGEMSLVGPRPISELEYDKYGVWQENFMSVKPGLTGLWQVSGRSDLDFEDRVKLDMYYIRNWSIWLDLRIILKTLTVLVSKEGAY